ncbi:hypothetical protein [Coleofasciculus sp.]
MTNDVACFSREASSSPFTLIMSTYLPNLPMNVPLEPSTLWLISGRILQD